MLRRDLMAIAVGYLLGSIPFAHVITRWRSGLDIRRVGIGNAGARNVWHVVGPGWGVAVAVLDAAKGSAAVLLAQGLGASTAGALLVGPGAILGHAFPLFLCLRGGKGLATTMGVLLVWTPWSALASLATLMVTQLLLRNLDRSIPFGAGVAVFFPPLLGYPWAMSLYALGLFCILWVRKAQDLPHQRRIWAASGWRGVDRSDWYGESRPTQDASRTSSRG